MKHFILIDNYSDYTEIVDLKGLIELLVNELEQDTINNFEKDILENNFKILKDIIKLQQQNNNYDRLVTLAIKELDGYGWKVKDINDLRKDLETLTESKIFKDGSNIEIDRKCLNNALNILKEVVR